MIRASRLFGIDSVDYEGHGFSELCAAIHVKQLREACFPRVLVELQTRSLSEVRDWVARLGQSNLAAVVMHRAADGAPLAHVVIGCDSDALRSVMTIVELPANARDGYVLAMPTGFESDFGLREIDRSLPPAEIIPASAFDTVVVAGDDVDRNHLQTSASFWEPLLGMCLLDERSTSFEQRWNVATARPGPLVIGVRSGTYVLRSRESTIELPSPLEVENELRRTRRMK